MEWDAFSSAMQLGVKMQFTDETKVENGVSGSTATSGCHCTLFKGKSNK